MANLRPHWLRTRVPGGDGYARVRRLLRKRGLATVCDEARCPNKSECWACGTATFLLMGETCTRGCRFCSVATARGPLPPPAADEGERVVEAARLLGLGHVVLTSVTRDDLDDGGAGHIAAVVEEIHRELPGVHVEVLVPPLDDPGIERVIAAGVDVFAHNVEVVRRLTREVRDPRADHDRSLDVLATARRMAPDVLTKSSLLLGLGETDDEIPETLDELRAAGVGAVAIGQYLQPTRRQLPVRRWITPDEWDRIRKQARGRGFVHVAADPFVRTSYRAHEALEAASGRER